MPLRQTWHGSPFLFCWVEPSNHSSLHSYPSTTHAKPPDPNNRPHTQFYSWYFHALPALAFHALPPPLAPLPLLGIEYAFNVFPATAASSWVLQVCRFQGWLE